MKKVLITLSAIAIAAAFSSCATSKKACCADGKGACCKAEVVCSK